MPHDVAFLIVLALGGLAFAITCAAIRPSLGRDEWRDRPAPGACDCLGCSGVERRCRGPPGDVGTPENNTAR